MNDYIICTQNIEDQNFGNNPGKTTYIRIPEDTTVAGADLQSAHLVMDLRFHRNRKKDLVQFVSDGVLSVFV
jgi:hypothetical protein